MNRSVLWVLRLLAVAALAVEFIGLVIGNRQMLHVGFLTGMAVVAVGWAVTAGEGERR